LSGSTGGSSVKVTDTLERPAPRRHFSTESLNELLFWGIHLAIVAISLGIMWVKIDGNTKALKTLIAAQDKELELVRQQVLVEATSAQEEHKAEQQRSIQFSAAFAALSAIQADVKDALNKSTQTNNLVLEAAQATEKAALESKSAASGAETLAMRAAGTAGAAAAAAGRAAASSSHTSSVVASKVVTSSDKRALSAQQAALAAKQQKLEKTIKRVKVKGPNLFDKLFH